MDEARPPTAPRLFLVGAMLVASLLWTAVTGGRALGALAAIVALASLGRSLPARLSAPIQMLLMLAAGMLAFAFTTFLPAEGALAERALRPGWTVIGSAALLIAAVRTHLLRPEGGLALTLGLALLVFVSAGSVRSGPLYPLLGLVFIALLFAAARTGDPERPAWKSLRVRHKSALAFILVFSATSAIALALTLPRFYDTANAWALRWLKDRMQSGFHDGPMALGALDGMLMSDDVVLRVEGPAGDLLRGNVYTVYARERWMTPQRREDIIHAPSERLAIGAAGVATLRNAARGTDRFFLPLDASAIEPKPQRLRIDANGIARTQADEAPEWVRVLRTGTPRFPPAPPDQGDLQIPPKLVERLTRLANVWTADATTSAARMAALESRLERDYTYSLEFERGNNEARAAEDYDPVLHFLLEEPVGHCQYFASALALLARASGVPTRLVTGYRVAEHNRLGDYHIVRERHAHAWVEAYLPERGWVNFDPSPLRSFETASARNTPLLPALIDWCALAVQRSGPEPLLIALVLGMAAIQLRRIRRGKSGDRKIRAVASRPPRELEALLGKLRDKGWPRAESETLESYASRLSRMGGANAASTANADNLLTRYAALRYGELGDALALARDVRGWLSRTP